MAVSGVEREPAAPAAPGGDRPRRPRGWLRAALRPSEVRAALVAAVLFAAAGLAQLAGAPPACWWGLYLASYLAGGWQPGWAGLRALRNRVLDVDLLMVLAAIVAATLGQVLDGALLILIFATSGALEAVATARTAESVRALLDLAPEQVTRLRGAAPDGAGGVPERVHAVTLAVGDVVLVRPGERIGADALVVAGVSEVDQAGITGEALPGLKQTGDEVFAGTMNGTGSLRVRVIRPAGESVIARIVALVEQASASKAKLQLFVERVEQRYSVAMVAATVLLFVVPLVLGAALRPTLLRAMTFMIVASPCAVVLATMPPLLASIANAGRHGILVKSAVVMELLGRTDTVVFDKTGTLTEGRPVVVAMCAPPRARHCTRRGAPPAAGGAAREDALLTCAAAAEQDSEHPLGRAVVAAARERGLAVPAATAFASTPGRGISARVGPHRVRVGSLRPPAGPRGTPGPLHGPLAEWVGQQQRAGRTAVLVHVDHAPVGAIALADRLRGDAAATVAQLSGLTGRTPLLLTGDQPGPARAVGDAVGIADVQAGLLPDGKADRVRALRAGGRRVLFVGDGVNDAPAIATADLGLAMGRSGSDLALRTADAVSVRDELAGLPAVIALSRRARRLVVANLVFAAAVICVLVTWDLVATLPLPLGVAGHEGSTVVVGLNGLRLLRRRAWTVRPARPAGSPRSARNR